MSEKVKVGIVGGAGYTGAELLRILLRHPEVSVEVVTSRGEKGVRLDEVWPNLRSHTELRYEAPDMESLSERCDVVFFATPHTIAMSMAATLIENNVIVIDLSADFRIKDIPLWEDWYNEKHLAPELVEQAVYGLPETSREQIKNANLIACPGCYPTAIQLGFIPLLEQKLIATSGLIANAASGVSGAGKQAKVANLFSEMSDSFKAYGVSGHRHLPEIEQGLTAVAGESVSLTFVPHLLPTIRGIHATLYCQPYSFDVDFQKVFEERYANEPFVDVLPRGVYPQTRSVKSTNVCQISVESLPRSNQLCVMSVEDNLTKGAAGQAVQAMNIRLGFDEGVGLNDIALMP